MDTVRVVEHEHRWVDITTWGDLPRTVEMCALGCDQRRVTVPRLADQPECANHRPVQHRDMKPPWCPACHWTSAVAAQPAMHKDEA